MISKEEIEKIKKGLTEELGRTITANVCGLSTNILGNGIDDTLKTATQIKVENQQNYLYQEKVENLENTIQKLRKEKREIIWIMLTDKQELKYNTTKREAEIQLKLIDKYLKIMKGENDERD